MRHPWAVSYDLVGPKRGRRGGDEMGVRERGRGVGMVSRRGGGGGKGPTVS